MSAIVLTLQLRDANTGNAASKQIPFEPLCRIGSCQLGRIFQSELRLLQHQLSQPPARTKPAAPESGPGIQPGQQSGNGLQIEPTEPPSSGNLEPVPPLHSSPADFTLCPKCGEKHPTTPYR